MEKKGGGTNKLIHKTDVEWQMQETNVTYQEIREEG